MFKNVKKVEFYNSKQTHWIFFFFKISGREEKKKGAHGLHCMTCLSPSLMTPLSIISLYKSLPSRVRSPTPANTEKPPDQRKPESFQQTCFVIKKIKTSSICIVINQPCALATLLMSSMISTVLPTPAPPKRPIFPPLWYGARRSTTCTWKKDKYNIHFEMKRTDVWLKLRKMLSQVQIIWRTDNKP